MDNSLRNNPFALLFPSVCEAQQFSQKLISPSQPPPTVAMETAANEKALAKNDVIQTHVAEEETVLDIEQRNNEDGEIKEKAKIKIEMNQVIEEIFCFTLNKDSVFIPGGVLNAVYLEDLARALYPQDWIDLETLEQALFERLMLEEPDKFVVSVSKAPVSAHATERKLVIYLYEAFRRCDTLRKNKRKENLVTTLNKINELIIRNIVTGLKQPEIFYSQEIHQQLLDLFISETGLDTKVRMFLDAVIQEFTIETEMQEVSLTEALKPLLDLILNEIKKLSLMGFSHAYIDMLQYFASNQHLGKVLIQHNLPREGADGRVYGDTIIGSLLMLSCLPKRELGPYLFFEKPSSQPPQVHSITEGNIWTSQETLNSAVYSVIYSLLKCSPEVKHLTLKWIGDCLHANSGRGKLWNAQLGSILSSGYVPDGFMLNLGSVMLQLCQPFCSDHHNLKLLQIDPTYCAVEVANEDESRRRGIHMKELTKETYIIPVVQEGEVRKCSKNFTFITECFFLAHKTLDLGFRITNEKFMKLRQELNQLQRVYQEAQAQNGQSTGAVQDIKDRMDATMSKFLSVKAALLEPRMLELAMQFHVSTAVLLTQLATEECSEGESLYKSKLSFHEIKFPLPMVISGHLNCIPEFIIENIAECLILLRQFSPKTLEEIGPSLDHILTFILVFMGSPERMKNPHLRAKLAECLECVMPHSDEPSSSLLLGSFHRERLFRDHPHKLEIVPTLLHVFVSIEMTGQSVAFEQKFNYRRPMYNIMDYLWSMDLYRDKFKDLAKEAEANIEAVNPPIFLHFINLLINDAIFLLDEALSYMSQLREQQAERDAGEWSNLQSQQRQQNETSFYHMGMLARFHNVMGKETIHVLEMLSDKIKSIFTHPMMVDRIASMLNYFLLHLVGPKMKNYKVKDLNKYEFKPADIVTDICQIYLHLEMSDAFCLAVSQDGRSYSPQLFVQAEGVLSRIGKGAMIPSLQAVAQKVLNAAAEQQTEEEMLADAPEEFLDPIMLTVMMDPVVLPSSGITVDRQTIARHLLSDQTDPFNRAPLTMDMVRPNEYLQKKIIDWRNKQREKKTLLK